MATTIFPTGATATTFPVPPRDLDLGNADESTLALYGLSALRMSMRDALLQRKGPPPTFIEAIFKIRKGVHAPVIKSTLGSTNWSGYVVRPPQGSTFNQVAGSWNTPDPEPAANDGQSYYASSWIGIDGTGGSPDVFQAGVTSNALNNNGAVQKEIYAWWEWFPEVEIEITNFPVDAGDIVECALHATSSTAGVATFRNLSKDTVTTFTFTAPSNTHLLGNVAEWIVERQTINGHLPLLANYTEVEFTDCVAMTNQSQSITPNQGDLVELDQGGAIVSTARVPDAQTVICEYVGSSVFEPVPLNGWLAVQIGQNLYAKTGALNGDWIYQAGNVRSFALDNKRLGFCDTNGVLFVKENDLNAPWVTETGGVQSFALTGGSIAVLDANGNLYEKLGDLSAQWVLQTTNVRKFARADLRIGVLTNDRKLFVKETNGWVLVANDVADFALCEWRIAVIGDDRKLHMKDGAITDAWFEVALDVTSFALQGAYSVYDPRIAFLNSAGELNAKEGALTNAWVLETGGISKFALEGDRIAVLSGDELYVKQGPLDAHWSLQARGVSDFKLNENLTGVLDSGRTLRVKAGGLVGAFFVQDEQVDAFALSDFTRRPPISRTYTAGFSF